MLRFMATSSTMTAAGDLLCQILNQSVLGDLSSGNGKSVNNNNEENSHSGNNDGGNDNDGSNDVKNVNGTVAGEEARDINSIEDQANALEQNVRSDKLGNVSNVDNNCTNIIITENESIAANRSGSSSSSKDDEHRDIKIDWVRVAEFALVGGTLHGPMWGTAFSALDRRYGANSGVLRKVGATMLLSPVYTMCFFGYMAVLESLKIRYYYESGNSSDRCNSLSDRREIKKYSDSESYKKSGDFSSRFPSSSSSSSPSSLSSTPLSESLKSSSQSSPLAPPPISIYDDVVIRLEGKMEKVVPTVAVSYCFWPVANAFNFGVVPPPYRLAAINVVAVVWNAFLSYVNSTDFAERFHEKAKGTFSL